MYVCETRICETFCIFLKCKHAIVFIFTAELRDVQYMPHNKKKTDIAKSHYALVIRAALR